MLSVCLIVRDEEEVLARCLCDVAPVCDEIIIADTPIKKNYTKNLQKRYCTRTYFVVYWP
jgi:hypothetical protein